MMMPTRKTILKVILPFLVLAQISCARSASGIGPNVTGPSNTDTPATAQAKVECAKSALRYMAFMKQMDTAENRMKALQTFDKMCTSDPIGSKQRFDLAAAIEIGRAAKAISESIQPFLKNGYTAEKYEKAFGERPGQSTNNRTSAEPPALLHLEP